MQNADELGSPNRLVFHDETYAIVGAAMDVYYKLGCGFLEPVYQEALAIEMGLRQIPFVPQAELPIKYKDFTLNKHYRADFICYEKIIVEIKALSSLTPVDWVQLLNYMKASQFRVGLLFNFGSAGRLEQKRMII
ncbi:MAG TPA: GxxExxY protein [Pyrinomonadaceae bacterium]|nr:GxxExxY protein [Pyrinomonadaceae bacterium]